MPAPRARDRAVVATVLALAAFLAVVALVDAPGEPAGDPRSGPSVPPSPSAPSSAPEVLAPVVWPRPLPLVRRPPAVLPGGGRRVFAAGRFLVAYYGSAGGGALGVLGETPVDRAHRRLVRAAAPFRRRGERIQPVYELIVTVADAVPGRDRDFSHDIARHHVRRYLRAAHRHRALVVLDLQPGRSGFLPVARRWAWALRDPWVGLALDPEWRMGGRQVPGRVIGGVGAREVNRTSAWLAGLVRRHDLPEKLLVLHQFRHSMLREPARIRPRPGLALLQHVDGFGTPRQKRATYDAVARPRQFRLGLKLFYDEDRPRMGPAAVRRLRPAVSFVSFQ